MQNALRGHGAHPTVLPGGEQTLLEVQETPQSASMEHNAQRILLGPETQAWPARTKRRGQSRAWLMPMRTVMSGSAGGPPPSRIWSAEDGSVRSRPL